MSSREPGLSTFSRMRRRRWGSVVVSTSVIGLGAVVGSFLLMVLGLLLGFVIGGVWLVERLRCQRCGANVWLGRSGLGTMWTPRRCWKCGQDLRADFERPRRG